MHPIQSLKARYQSFLSRHFEWSRDGRNLAKYRDLHKGETCFFIGNGPSLRAEDLTAIHQAGYATFAFNRIFHIFDHTEWRPTYYISQDEKMLAGCQEEINKLPLSHKFIPVNLEWYFNIHVNGGEGFLLKSNPDDSLGFSDDIRKSVCWASTVMYTAAQFAAYMGFMTIYLIGVDHHFHISRNINGDIVVDDSVKDYFTDAYNHDRDKLYIPNTDISTKTYCAMKKYGDERHIQIFNATRGGKLEVFPRVDLDMLL